MAIKVELRTDGEINVELTGADSAMVLGNAYSYAKELLVPGHSQPEQYVPDYLVNLIEKDTRTMIGGAKGRKRDGRSNGREKSNWIRILSRKNQ